MRAEATKLQLLENAGYYYNFDRLVYVNRDARKAFSIEFVQDHNDTDLAARIKETISPAEWRFYFNVAPSDAVKRELSAILGNGRTND
jgi:hypothetical protein